MFLALPNGSSLGLDTADGGLEIKGASSGEISGFSGEGDLSSFGPFSRLSCGASSNGSSGTVLASAGTEISAGLSPSARATSAVSSTSRLQYPHSLSYQATTLTKLPATTCVSFKSTIAE